MVARVFRALHIRSQRLHRGHSQAVARLDLRMGVVAHHEHFVRGVASFTADEVEHGLLAQMTGFVDGIHLRGFEEGSDAERADLAFLEPAKTRGDEMELRPEVRQQREIRVAGHWFLHLDGAERLPSGTEHFRGVMVTLRHEVQGVDPRVGEGGLQFLIRQCPLVCFPDGLEARFEEYPAHFLGRSQAVVQVEDDRTDGRFAHAGMIAGVAGFSSPGPRSADRWSSVADGALLTSGGCRPACRMKAVFLCLVPALILACRFSPMAGAEEEKPPVKPEEKQPEEPGKKVVPADPFKPETLVGQTLAKATELADAEKIPNRVIREDGKARMVTRDYRPGRLNFTVVKGIVTEVDVEGKK